MYVSVYARVLLTHISKTFYICVCRLKPMTFLIITFSNFCLILQCSFHISMFVKHHFRMLTSLVLTVFELPTGLLNQCSYSSVWDSCTFTCCPLPPTSLCSLCSWILALLYIYPLSSPSYWEGKWKSNRNDWYIWTSNNK